MVVKRSSSESSSDDTSEKKPKLSTKDSSSDNDDFEPKKGKKKGGKQTRVRTNWTSEEDMILVDLMQQAMKNGLWELVKADGCLSHRGSTGIQVHSTSLMNKLKGTN